MPTPITLISRFMALPKAQRHVFALSVVMLPMIRVGLRTVGFKFINARLTQGAALQSTHRTPLSIEQVVKTLNIAERYSPSALNCLSRSLLLRWWLARNGMHSELRIGVRRSGSSLDAHAWVEFQGAPINDDEAVGERYAAFEGEL